VITGIFISLLNPVFVSLQNVAARKGLTRGDVEDMAVVFSRLFYVVPVLLAYLWWKGMPAKIDPYFWPTMLVLVLLEIPSQWFFHQAIKTEQISLVMPISTLIMIPMLSSFVFFSGWSWLGFAGSMTVAFGVYLLQASKEGLSTHNLLAPIRSIITNKASRYMLYTIVLWSITTPLQKVTANQSSVAFMGVIYLSGCSIGVIVWRLIRRQSVKSVIAPPGTVRLIPVGLLAGGGSITQYWALSVMNPVYVIALKETILLWAIIWDRMFFGHKPSKMQIASTCLVVIGAAMVGISMY